MEVETYICPGCETELRIGTYGCPKCSPIPIRKGAKPVARKNWQHEAKYDALDLPDEDFDYDDFVAREFDKVSPKKVGIRWYWWLTAVILLILAILGAGSL